MPLLAALFIGAAGAVQESEQVLLDGDKASFEPVSTELVEINGVPTLTKTFELLPEIDPSSAARGTVFTGRLLVPLSADGKGRPETTDTQPVEETVTVDAPSGELADVIGQFPATRSYSKDGYTGELVLDVQSITVEATGYSTVTDGHPHTVTKTYELAYNDRSLVPETVQADGLTLPLTGLSWSENEKRGGFRCSRGLDGNGDIYSKTTYTPREVADGYRATAVYKGRGGENQCRERGLHRDLYGKTRYRSCLADPTLPCAGRDRGRAGGFPSGGSALVSALAYCPHVYVYNEERRIHDVVTASMWGTDAEDTAGHDAGARRETEYTVILRKRLAKRLVGRDIAIGTGGEGQHHVVESFVGSDYAFQVRI